LQKVLKRTKKIKNIGKEALIKNLFYFKAIEKWSHNKENG
jgi:hypothetical protein